MKKTDSIGNDKKKKASNRKGAKGMQERTFRKKELFLQTFGQKACNISETCEAIGISRETYYDWIKTDKAFAEAVKIENEKLIDMAETQLMINIRQGKEASLFFYLVNRKPDRWKSIQKVEHSGKVEVNNNPVNILNLRDKKTGRKIGEIIAEVDTVEIEK